MTEERTAVRLDPDLPGVHVARARQVDARTYLPARRRWMRVRFSSLRCFFFAIRFRRFLMTEPTCGPLDILGALASETNTLLAFVAFDAGLRTNRSRATRTRQ